MSDLRYVSVRTRRGVKGHKAVRQQPEITLCGYEVKFTRKGGSWAPEHPRAWDHVDECQRCEKESGTGP